MIPINLDALISTITGIVSPTAFIKSKLERNETVIKLLKQFNLDPEHPPTDFGGVYVYALVQYGIGKPKPILEFFRQTEIQQAFRQAFEQNNPSVLLKQGEVFISSHSLGDEIRDLGIEPRREFAAFAAVFIEIANRTRTPSEVRRDQKLDNLHHRLGGIQERLDRLQTVEGIRTEMARLAAQNYPALSASETSNAQKCRAFVLAQQMRGWFETLGYRFEPYEVWEDSYFEWIINIPVRRHRYDRILVRGIEGEAGIKDIMALRQSVDEQKADEGWLVTARRISRAARDEVDKERHLGCYTFDELLDQDADFSRYLNWLETEVKRRDIDKKYVPLACTKEEFDSVTKQRIAVSRYDERDRWIDGYIDIWLDDPAKEHISVLGEFGTGKTWFALHYAWTALQHYRNAKERGVERPRVPLVIPLRDYAKAVSVESLFSEFFFRKHEIPIPGYSAFEQLNRMGKLLLIFDGFDEMAARVDRQDMINNFWELAKVVVPGAKVILTCRTEHFPEAKEGRALLNAELQASTANLTGETPQFEVLELEKFDDDQIRQVFSFQAEPATVGQVMGNPQLLDLARRPVMTELILEALPDIEAGKPVDMSRVYLYAVRRKMERDIKAERTFTSLADKLYFLCELSWEMLSTDHMSLNYRLFPDRIRRLFGSVVREEKDLDHWHFDMMGQTMLIRNADGDYTPAHRSLLEFFVAYKFAAELGVLATDFTELARSQSHLDVATPQDYKWSSYFRRQADEAGTIVPIPSLRTFVSETITQLRKTFGQAPLTKAVMDLIMPMLDIQTSSPPLLEILEETRGKTEAEVGYVGGNAATLLVKVDKCALKGRNLSRSVIIGADFTNASLHRVNFAHSNLANSVFTKNLGDVKSVAFTPDSKLLATGDSHDVVHLWEAASGREIFTCKGHTNLVESVAVSPSGKILASGSFDQTVRLWDIHTGECLKILRGHTKSVFSVAVSPSGKTLASGSFDQTVRLWDISTGKCLNILQGHTEAVCSIAFSPSGQMFASGSFDQTVRLWDISTGKCLNILQGHTKTVCSIAFSPSGQMSASGSADKTVRLWDIHNGECLKILQGHTDKVFSVAFSPADELLASGSANKTVRLWNVHTGECLKILQGHGNTIKSITFSPDDKMLASGSYDQMARIWDVSTGRCIKTLEGHTSQVDSVAFSPAGNILASGSKDQTVRLWDVHTGECLNTLQNHGSRVGSVAFSPAGDILASGSKDQMVRLWDSHDGKCLNTLQGHTSSVRSVAFSPTAEILASGSDDRTVRLWNIHTGKCLNTLQGHTNWITLVAFSPLGEMLASGSYDQTVRLWDIRTGECLKILDQDTYLVRSVAFSPDGKVLAISADQTVKLWDISTGKCLKILQSHNSRVNSVSFSLDGKILASCSNTIKLWNFETGECLKTMRLEKLYEGMNILGAIGLTEVEKATLKALGAVEDGDLQKLDKLPGS